MGKKRDFSLVVFLAIVLLGFAFMLLDNRYGLISRYAEHRLKEEQSADAEKEKSEAVYGEMYNGEMHIKVNPITSLNGMTTEQIADFRIQKVQEYERLNIFPENYDPLKMPHYEIYRPMTSGADWLPPAQFYVCNPYLLIILACDDHVTSLITSIRQPEIKYSKVGTYGLIEETYEGADAREWFRSLYQDYSDHPGVVRVWMVNAYDAGFKYVHVDVKQSINLDASAMAAGANITSSIYSQSGVFHVGRYGKNNLSPSDSRAWIKLLQLYVIRRDCRNKPISQGVV